MQVFVNFAERASNKLCNRFGRNGNIVPLVFRVFFLPCLGVGESEEASEQVGRGGRSLLKTEGYRRPRWRRWRGGGTGTGKMSAGRGGG